jgi:DNA polymerase-3 subunit delta'
MRSIDFNWNMLGHEWAVDLLRGHSQKERIRHAYLITGPQGIGRRTLAIRLAQVLNCSQSPEPGMPCGACRACKLIERMQHPDFAVVQAPEAGKALKVDQIRELQRTLSLAPYEARTKVALLLRFEEANLNAANALLKTLEEPPAQVIMILTANDAETLLPTIVSRCELIRLRPLSLEQTVAGLQSRWDLPAEQARLLAHLSGGRPGFALGLHQNPDGLAQRQSQLADHHQLLGASRVERFHYAEDLAKDKTTLYNTLQTWLTLWRDVMLRAAGSSAPLTNIDQADEISTLVQNFNLSTAQAMVNNLERSLSQLDRYMNTRLVTEVLMLDLPRI